MKQIFEDDGEIDHVIDLIEKQWTLEQWDDAKRELYEMRTAKHLAELLRNELLEDGITTPEQIIDVNEIVYWYLDKKVSPGMWQYAFADCLAALWTYFDKQLVPTDDVFERLESSNQLNDLRDRCVKVFHADQSRIRAANIRKLRPLAEIGVRVSAGGTKGQIKTYGDLATKEAKYKLWQDWINDEAEKNPEHSFESIKKKVAKNNPVSVHQLKRRTKDPRKKT